MMKKDIKYEDDLQYFIKIRNKNKKVYEKFLKAFDRFIMDAGIENGEINYKTPYTLATYFKNNKEEILFLFDSLKDSDIGFDYNKINNLFYELTLREKINFKYKTVKNSRDIINYTNELLFSLNEKALAIWFYVLKFNVFLYGNRLKSVMSFLHDAYKPFSRYYELITNKKEVSDDLIDSIVKLFTHSTFAIINDNMEFEDGNIEKNNISFINYSTGFINYTNEHNKSIKNIRFFKPKYEKPLDKKIDLVQPSIMPINNEKIEIDNTNEIINNYVDSYFSVLCSFEGTNIKSSLPNPSIKGYDKIMELLLEKYEKYLDDLAKKGNCTMDKNHIYCELQTIVNNMSLH